MKPPAQLSPLVRLAIEAGPLAVFMIANGRFGLFIGTGIFRVATLASLLAGGFQEGCQARSSSVDSGTPQSMIDQPRRVASRRNAGDALTAIAAPPLASAASNAGRSET